MAIKVELNDYSSVSSGIVLQAPAAVVEASPEQASYAESTKDSKACSGLFCFNNFFPLLGLFAGRNNSAENIAEMPLGELEARAAVLAEKITPFEGVNNNISQLVLEPVGKRADTLEAIAKDLLELLKIDAEIIYRYFLEASNLYVSNQEQENPRLAKALALVEQVVRSFSSATKNITFLYSLESETLRPSRVSGPNVLSLNQAFVDVLLFVSEVTGGRGAFSLVQGAINNIVAVLENSDDVRRLGVLESIYVSYQTYLPQRLLQSQLMQTATQKFEACKDSILQFIADELRKSGRASEFHEMWLEQERENIAGIIKAGRTNSFGVSNFFNDGTTSSPHFVFFSEALMREIEVEPFYQQLIEGREPLFEVVPLLGAPVFQLSAFQKRDFEAFEQVLSHAFKSRNGEFMEALEKMRERLLEAKTTTSRKMEKR